MVVTILSALAEPTRLAALRILWDQGEHCACELIARLDATQSRVSRHMRVLKQAGLVADRRDAQWVRYRINPDLPADVQTLLRTVIEMDDQSERTAA
ncbi:ArsR/SmtB family transcription factor [Pseudodonghicola xiamenensis]|uniref:Transcriptional regulator n=1 Tax=Pseudodonghicola xiamenensis TaxID=337702 RepID=A0A8J3MG65_9RHOB|nr:metalloregulator ArsR/SmtB family transcription factor [Pseudodonghicola xiamenensis]GHG99028.1 transcriptional regulator [Pseudodonghicola xiamenensis]